MINELVNKIKKTGPVVVGLDPNIDYVPKYIMNRSIEAHGETFDAIGDAIYEYNKGLIDCIYDIIPAVKPQVAMYEQFGIAGMVAYKNTVEYAKSKGLVVIGDVKRGDIGSTSAAYARAHLGSIKVGDSLIRAFDTDFATVNPYFGIDGVKPFIDVCKIEKKGIFVLVKTSNPSSGELQDQMVDGAPLYELVGNMVSNWGRECMGDSYSYIGAVVGATYPKMGEVLRKIMPKTYILVPGYGAQGATAKDLSVFFDKDGLGAIVNSSRGIIAAYKQDGYSDYGEVAYGDVARIETLKMLDDIKSNI